MKIGLNLLYRVPSAGGGVETYVQSLINQVIQLDTKNEYTLFVSGTAKMFPLPDKRNVTVVRCAVDSNKRGSRYLWEQVILPAQVRKHKVQMLHSLNYVSPVVCPCKTLVTFQDLSYREPTVEMPAIRRLGLTLFSTLSALSTDAVVTVSEFSKKRICSSLHVTEDKVRVVPSGPGWNSDRPSRTAIEHALAKYRIARPYVVAFAGGYPHKNITRLLAAFQAACKKMEHGLVLIGRLPEHVEIAPPFVDYEFRNRVHHLGHIPTDDIHPLLGGADLFVFPSLYEGFGFPLLEAQKAGVAVACSNVASIPEVAGIGAIYFDPLSVDGITGALSNCLSNAGLRARLVQSGFENVRRFSWKEAAKSYIELYNELGN